MPQTVLILGASGKIGTHAARAFRAAGWTVRLYDRKAGNMTAAAIGADVIVNGLNPPAYHNWAKLIPEITGQVIAAAKASGAAVIIPGNVYVYGAQSGPWSEATPHRPNSRKGKIRADMERRYATSGVQTIVLRAGNFIDPDRNGDVFSLLLLRNLHKGRITTGGDPDVMQSYCYLPDWAQAAVALAEKRSTLAQFEDVPLAGQTFSVTMLKTVIERQTGRALRISAFPWWVMRLASPFWELARELSEMRYLNDTPHSLSGEKLLRLLPDHKDTPYEQAIAAAIAAQGRAISTQTSR